MGRYRVPPRKYQTRQALRRERGLKRCGGVQPPHNVVVEEDPRTKKVKVYGAKPLDEERMGGWEFTREYLGKSPYFLNLNTVTPKSSFWRLTRYINESMVITSGQEFCFVGLRYSSGGVSHVVTLQTFPVYDVDGSSHTLYLPDQLEDLAYESGVQWSRRLNLAPNLIMGTVLRNTRLSVHGYDTLRGEAHLYEGAALTSGYDHPSLHKLRLHNDSRVEGKCIGGSLLAADTCCDIKLNECTAPCTEISAEASCTIKVDKGKCYRLRKPLLASTVTFNGVTERD